MCPDWRRRKIYPLHNVNDDYCRKETDRIYENYPLSVRVVLSIHYARDLLMVTLYKPL